MFSCPACGNTDVNDRMRCTCGADLSLLQSIDAQVDAWFNRALHASKEGRPGEALEWLAACCRVRPSDAQAYLALAKLWAQLEHWDDAVRCLNCATELKSDLPEFETLRKAIKEHAPVREDIEESSKKRHI